MSKPDLTSFEATDLRNFLHGVAFSIVDADDDSAMEWHAGTFVDGLSETESDLLLSELLDDSAWHVALNEVQLDECQQSTYSCIETISNALRATAAGQGDTDGLLRRLVLSKLVQETSSVRLIGWRERTDRREAVITAAAGRSAGRYYVPGMPCDTSCGPSYCAEACAELSPGRTPGGAA